MSPDIVPADGAGEDAVEYTAPHEEAQTDEQAEAAGDRENWVFWDKQLRAALIHERRFRLEAEEVERDYFGEDKDPGVSAGVEGARSTTTITDKTALLHSNVEVLKPLLYSETPQPVVRRRFRGDGKVTETDLMAAEVGQRLATFLIDTEPFDDVMELVRDDWLVPGRGAARVMYKAEISVEQQQDPATGEVVEIPLKTKERVTPRYVEWPRLILAPTTSWETLPWKAFEIPMNRTEVEARFGKEIADAMTYNQQGLVHASFASTKDDGRASNETRDESETGDVAPSPFDTVNVVEIWNKATGEVIWWSTGYKDKILDKVQDPLGLEEFWPMPKPLMAATKRETLTPRPDIKYYERRAREIDLASRKLKTILDVLSVSGLFPGTMENEVQKLLDGSSQMIPVQAWLQLMEKGGTNNIIQWLPLQEMIAAIQALVTLREQAKMAMFEASGVSDVMRAQGDPNATATQEQIKGRYAGLRLADKQRKIAEYARDLLRLMIEVALEHFDTDYLADICGLDLPITEMDRAAMVAEQQAIMAQYQEAMQLHQLALQAVEAGLIAQAPPEPQEPKLERIPETSWELVHERLRTDYGRKISVTIETNSTVLADEQADKEARIEFLSAFSKMVAELLPLVGSGAFDPKTIKELLLFGVRGFPKSRTLESLIAQLPDEPEGESPEDTAVTVAKIKAEVDQKLEEMRQQNNEADRQHEMKMKGVEVIADGVQMAADAASEPQPQPA